MTATNASAELDGQTASARPAEPLNAGRATAAGPSPLIDEYEAVLQQQVVSFEQVVQAAFGRRPSQTPSSDQAIHAQYYPRLLQSFAAAHRCPSRPNHPGILHYYFADHIDAAVLMTADDELYVQYKPTGSDEVAFIDLLIRMTGVHIKARHVLQKEDYRTIMETVFVIISYCLSSLDHERSGHNQPEAGKRAERERADALRFLRSECARVEQDLDNIIHRRAERTYFNGMLGAVLALGLAGVVLANLLDQSGNFDNYKYLLVAGLAGSIGATISVMWRITFGRFSPSNAIIAFFAGFSERWAQSTLKNAIPLSGRSTANPDTLSSASHPEGKSPR